MCVDLFAKIIHIWNDLYLIFIFIFILSLVSIAIIVNLT